MAIDREIIVKTVLQGFARPIAMRYWGNHESELEVRMWEYNSERAQVAD